MVVRGKFRAAGVGSLQASLEALQRQMHESLAEETNRRDRSLNDLHSVHGRTRGLKHDLTEGLRRFLFLVQNLGVRLYVVSAIVFAFFGGSTRPIL